MNDLLNTLNQPPPDDRQVYVAIDLGSNSFHMLIARDDNGTLQVIDKLKVMVQLASGLDAKNRLNEATKTRALNALALFGERIKQVEHARVRAIGTSTLRRAKKNEGFIEDAEALLGAPIEIISGAEEARLIYIGVCSDLPHDSHHRLVMDIGGGSTEFIIGTDRTPLQLESIHMGCISFSQQYATLPLQAKNLQNALNQVELNLQDVTQSLKMLGWQESIGASGSIKAVSKVCAQLYGDPNITPTNLSQLAKFLAQPHVSESYLAAEFGFEPERAAVFTGGFLVLYGSIKALGIEKMIASENAIREGVIWELIGREMAKDIRHSTVDALAVRFSVSRKQAHAVSNAVLHLLNGVEAAIPAQLEARNSLHWAAKLHEIGLAISHSSHHKHGHYLISHMDMPGFSKTVQYRIARLIRLHRKKLDTTIINEVSVAMRPAFCLMLLILRLGALLCRSHQMSFETVETLPTLSLDYQPEKQLASLKISSAWIAAHPLTAYDLDEEINQWQKSETPLSFIWLKT